MCLVSPTQFTILMDIGQKAFLNFIVAAMAATSAVKGSSKLHTSMIRCGAVSMQMQQRYMQSNAQHCAREIPCKPLFRSWNPVDVCMPPGCAIESNFPHRYEPRGVVAATSHQDYTSVRLRPDAVRPGTAEWLRVVTAGCRNGTAGCLCRVKRHFVRTQC